MEYLTLFFVGALSGLVAGIAGLGGGTVIVPVLTLWFGIAAMHDAIVASWFAVLFNSFSASLTQYKLRDAAERAQLVGASRHFLLGVLIVTPIVAMAVASFSQSIPPALVGAFQVTLAVSLLWPKTGSMEPRSMSKALDVLFGGLVGGASALTGTGGGAYTAAYMIFGPRQTLRDALAAGNLTGLAVGLLSVIGFLASMLVSTANDATASRTSISSGGLALLIASGLIFSSFGVRLSRKMNASILRKIVVAVLLASSVRLLMA